MRKMEDNTHTYRESEWFLNGSCRELSGGEAAFRIHYWGVNPRHYDNPVHRHAFFEVCYVVEGEGEYTDAGRDYKLEKGTMFCSCPGVTHQIRSRAGMALLYVAFEVNEEATGELHRAMYRRLAETDNVCVAGCDDSATALMWRALIARTPEGQPMAESTARGLAYALLLSLPVCFAGSREPKLRSFPRNASLALANRAKLFIRDNLAQQLSLDYVADYLHISKRHLTRVFAQEIDHSFASYVQQERLRHAVYLLRGTDLALKEVAEACGFRSVHYFTRVFTAAIGVAPGQFRTKKP